MDAVASADDTTVCAANTYPDYCRLIDDDADENRLTAADSPVVRSNSID